MPRALQRLVELCAHSQFLADQIAAHPLLLDELIDERLIEEPPTRERFEEELASRRAAMHGEDPERQVEMLRQFQRAALFRVAVADLTRPFAADEGERPADRYRRADRERSAGAGVGTDHCETRRARVSMRRTAARRRRA